VSSVAARRFRIGLVAAGTGILITVLGLVLQRRQMELTIESQSVRFIMDPGRNAVIDACLPALAVASKLVDYGPIGFVMLLLLNSAAWGLIVYVGGSWLVARMRREVAA